MTTMVDKLPIKADSLVTEKDITKERMKQVLLFAVQPEEGFLLVRDSMVSELQGLALEINHGQTHVSIGELQASSEADPASLLAAVAEAKAKKKIEVVHTPVSQIERRGVADAIIKIYNEGGRDLSDGVRQKVIDAIKRVLLYTATEGVVVLLSLPNNKTMRDTDQPIKVGSPLREPKR
jgi:hypothetical protein